MGKRNGYPFMISSSFFFYGTTCSAHVKPINYLFYISWAACRHCLPWFEEMLLFHKELLPIREGHWFPLGNCPGMFFHWVLQDLFPLSASAKKMLIMNNLWTRSQKSRGRNLVWKSSGLDTSPRERLATSPFHLLLPMPHYWKEWRCALFQWKMMFGFYSD